MLLECSLFILMTFLTGSQCDRVTEVFAEAGSQALLPCKCGPTSLSPAVIWSNANKGTVWRKQRSGLQYRGWSWLQKGIHRVRCPHTQFEKGDYSLQVYNVREEDGGLYTCAVDLGGKTVENTVMLRIITVSISPSVPISGRNVSVTCKVTPRPHGSSVQWRLNDSPFAPETRSPSNTDASQSIVTETAAARLTGNWTCVVGYKGKEGRASANLSVIGIIQPAADNTKVYAAVGSAATLPCVFSPGFIPSSPTWEKLRHGFILKPAPSHLLPSISRTSESSGLPWDRSATLREVGSEDEGEYRCSGTAHGQRLARNIQLVIAQIDSSVPSKKRGSVTLTCKLSDTSEVTEYEWVRVTYDVNGAQTVGSTQKGNTLTISHVTEENRGTWVCRFSGKNSMLGNITYHAPMTSALSGQHTKGLSHNTAAVIGLSVLLLVLLLVLAQVYKNHQRRKRAFQYPALETIVHTISNEREERDRNQVRK